MARLTKEQLQQIRDGRRVFSWEGMLDVFDTIDALEVEHSARIAAVRQEDAEIASRVSFGMPARDEILALISSDERDALAERIATAVLMAAEWIRDHIGASSGYHSRYLDLHIEKLRAAAHRDAK